MNGIPIVIIRKSWCSIVQVGSTGHLTRSLVETLNLSFFEYYVEQLNIEIDFQYVNPSLDYSKNERSIHISKIFIYNDDDDDFHR